MAEALTYTGGLYITAVKQLDELEAKDKEIARLHQVAKDGTAQITKMSEEKAVLTEQIAQLKNSWDGELAVFVVRVGSNAVPVAWFENVNQAEKFAGSYETASVRAEKILPRIA
jgi:cell division inhibitor SulA